MGTAESSFSFLPLRCLFLLSAAACAYGDANHATDGSYLFHICSSYNSYTAGSVYASNLNQALDHLATNAPPFGFGLSSVGEYLENQVHALALCRGDVSPPACETCIINATQAIKQRCPNKKVAAIWYNSCFLKYSNADFFAKIDDRNKFYMWNPRVIDNNPARFNEQVKSLLTSLAVKVQTTSELYAIDQVEIRPSQKLYGLVQCTKDLWGGACKMCLDSAISELSSCCNGRIGGRVIGGSCNFRYELYPIVDAQK